ncbi:MAG: thioredoxin family protein [Pirellulaceae bacterium]
MTGLTTSLLLVLATGAQPYDKAYETVQSDGQPLLVLVGADWCPACQTMKSSTMARLEQKGKLQGVAFTVVNSDRQSSLAQKIMRGSSIPQLVMYEKTEKGWQRTQLTGGQSEGQIEAFIARAVSRSQERIAAKAQFDMVSSGGE